MPLPSPLSGGSRVYTTVPVSKALRSSTASAAGLGSSVGATIASLSLESAISDFDPKKFVPKPWQHTSTHHPPSIPDLRVVYNIPALESELWRCGLYDSFSDVIAGLKYGFAMGDMPKLDRTITFVNHGEFSHSSEMVNDFLAEEFANGRIEGPFTQEQVQARLGHFQSSPLWAVPKTNEPEKWRVIRNLSYKGDAPGAANDYIDSDDFPCVWNGFSEVEQIVLNAPPGTQAASMDIKSAYRTVPADMVARKWLVFSIEGEYYIDKFLPFGASSAGGIFGRIADMIVAILKRHGIQPICKWVDDFLFFRFPVSGYPTYSYNLDSMKAITNPLGIPWHPDKERDFAPVARYIGFNWDLDKKFVSLVLEMQVKIFRKIVEFLEEDRNGGVSLGDVESLTGSLQHCVAVLGEGRSYLPALRHFASSFKSKRSLIHRVPENVVVDLVWWMEQLFGPPIGRPIRLPPREVDPDLWVDASTDWGIGAICGREWVAWKLWPGWNTPGRDIIWIETLAIELGVLFMIDKGYSNVSLVIHSDNMGVIGSLARGSCRNLEANSVIRRIFSLLAENGMQIKPIYVKSADNRADAISRGEKPWNTSKYGRPISVDPSLEDSLVVV